MPRTPRTDTPPAAARLTARQQAFVREYLIDLNATQAAIRAGYSAKTAPQTAARLLTNVKVAGAVAEAQTQRAERAALSAEDVLRGLQREAEREGEGASHAARVSAWGLLGKHLGMFVERTHVTVEDYRPEDYSLDENRRIAAGESPAAVRASRRVE